MSNPQGGQDGLHLFPDMLAGAADSATCRRPEGSAWEDF
jgi:hypothetical protein